MIPRPDWKGKHSVSVTFDHRSKRKGLRSVARHLSLCVNKLLGHFRDVLGFCRLLRTAECSPGLHSQNRCACVLLRLGDASAVVDGADGRGGLPLRRLRLRHPQQAPGEGQEGRGGGGRHVWV